MEFINGIQRVPRNVRPEFRWLKHFFHDIVRGMFSQDALRRVSAVLRCGENRMDDVDDYRRWQLHVLFCFRNKMNENLDFVLEKLDLLRIAIGNERRSIQRLPFQPLIDYDTDEEQMPPPVPDDFEEDFPRHLHRIEQQPPPLPPLPFDDDDEQMDLDDDASSPRKSVCHSKKAKSCKKSPRCTWSKGYDKKDGKHVNGNCRRRKSPGRKSSRRKSSRRKSPRRKSPGRK